MSGWLAGAFMLRPAPGDVANRSLSAGRGATLTGFSGIGALLAGRGDEGGIGDDDDDDLI